ncbi:MAG: glycoside hydrolase family 38 C-terminal domain-containing protein [Deinococcota bacterium]
MKHEQRLTLRNLRLKLNLIQDRIYCQKQVVEQFGYQPLAGPDADMPTEDANWQTLTPPCYWADWQTDVALRTRFNLPVTWGHPVAFVMPFDNPKDFNHPEAMVYLDGQRLAACDRQHHEVRLPDRVLDGREHVLELRGWTGLGDWKGVRPGSLPLLPRCAFAIIDEPTQQLVDVARLALELATNLTDDTPVKDLLLNAVLDNLNQLDTREPICDCFYADVVQVLPQLQEAIQACGPSLNAELIAIGHAHIDVAWLWTVAQTRRKAARSFSNALALMAQHPSFHFSQSQPQLYQYVQEDDPELFEQLKTRIDEGRWEVLSTAWVEMDCNLTGAEALIRQFILGEKYIRENLGEATKVMWLPDCFGFPASLPQVFKGVGMTAFITSKLSWNQYNDFPYDSFWWQGIDGSRMLSHFISTPEVSPLIGPKATYNGILDAQQTLGTWRAYKQKAENQVLLTAYGYGDGGGGPTRDMVTNAEQLANYPASPKVSMDTVKTFVEKLVPNAANFPTWQGELYFELHRGTYTSQARMKRNTRKAEQALHELEFLASYASLHGASYPHEHLTKIWQRICLQHFHDILPGSSIAQVYRDSEADFAYIFTEVEELRQRATNQLMQHVEADVVIINSSPFDRTQVVEVAISSDEVLVDGDGNMLMQQPLINSSGQLVLVNLPAYSLSSFSRARLSSETPKLTESVQVRVEGDIYILENTLICANINALGEVTSLFDKRLNCEMLSATGNHFQVFEDRSEPFDAWDINIYYEDRHWTFANEAQVSVLEQGPLRASLHVRRQYRNSSLEQVISLDVGSSRLDFATKVDWHEQHQLLKVAFPTTLQSPEATYHIQWGTVARPTHRNTSWDMARFEVPAHYWADLSQADAGISLLNDCKYGYDVLASTLRLTLIKSATHPDPDADQGMHVFTYSLLSHEGDWRTCTQPHGYQLNHPVRVMNHSAELVNANAQSLPPLIQVDAANIIVETIKQAEDGRGLIVRLYDGHGITSKVTLKSAFELVEVSRCDMLENIQETLAHDAHSIVLGINPYEIVTLRLEYP